MGSENMTDQRTKRLSDQPTDQPTDGHREGSLQNQKNERIAPHILIQGKNIYVYPMPKINWYKKHRANHFMIQSRPPCN